MIEPITGKLALEHWPHEAAELLEARFASYLDPVEDEDLEAAYDHDRYLFGDGFPALTVEEVASSESPPKKSKLPRRMLFAVRVYHPSLMGSLNPSLGTFEVARDARAEAKRFTRRVLGRWEEAFREDKSLRRSVEDAFVADTESGDADRLGNLRIRETGSGQSVLWVRRATIEIRP